MKNTLKGYLIGVLSTVLLLGTVCYAANNTKTIEALYNNIKIYVDGVKIDPKDANGNTVEPFIYNGTTYLPVRAMGEAIGKTVTWDGVTQSVYLGEKPGDVQYLMELCPPYAYEHCSLYTTENGKSFLMGGKKYTNGFTITKDWQTGFRYNGEISFNLNSKYKKLSFSIGTVDGKNTYLVDESTTVQFYLDDKLIKEIDLTTGNLPKEINLDVNYGMQLKISHTNNGLVGLGNITVE